MSIDKPDQLSEGDVVDHTEQDQESTIDQPEPNEVIDERRQDIDPEVVKYWEEQIEMLKKEVEHWKDRALRDKLTGLPNYDFFKEHIQPEIDDVADPDKKTESLGIVFIDMNGLKQLNDTLGHQVADEIIIKIAQTLNEQVRQTDWTARRSGDEFLVVLGGVNESKIQQAFHSFQSRVNVALAEPIMVGDQEVTTSVSMGFDSVLKNGEHKNWEDMAALAEKRMYEAKQAYRKSLTQA